MPGPNRQLISYIAPAAPATRRPATGSEPFLRPEIGFAPSWYRDSIGVDFDIRWHNDPAYRRETIIAMREELRRRFPATGIGGIDRPDKPLDILTGTYGTCAIAAIYGMPISYAPDKWPVCEKRYLSADQIDGLEPPNLDTNPFFQNLLSQVDWIAKQEGRTEGYINWQGVLNNAWRLRGEAILYDLFDAPERCRRLFDCVCTTMIDAARRLHDRQRKSGVNSTGKLAFSESTPSAAAYFAGNYMNGGCPGDPWALVSFSRFSPKDLEAYKQSSPIPVPSVKTDDAIAAYKRVMAEAGAVLPKRDAVDARIVNEVRDGTGKIIDDEDEVGGWPELKSVPPPEDCDADGMPDDWERRNGLNAGEPDDRNGDADGDGYTNLEEYLNNTKP